MSTRDDDEWWDGLAPERKAQIRRWLTSGDVSTDVAVPGQQELPIHNDKAPRVVEIRPRGGVV